MHNRMGSWWTVSKTDPRWNMSGRASVGGFEMPRECKERIALMETKFGPPPEDLTWEYMKD